MKAVPASLLATGTISFLRDTGANDATNFLRSVRAA